MSAVLSPCGLYRYLLVRSLGGLFEGRTVAWIMVNPSTADATENDATIRKVIGFSKRLNFGDVFVANLFAYRSTDIRALRTTADPVGPDNDAHLRAIMRAHETVIVAWGPGAKLPPALRSRWRVVADLAAEYGTPLWCIGTAQDGHPLHPLMQPYGRPLRLWQRPDLEALPQRGRAIVEREG